MGAGNLGLPRGLAIDGSARMFTVDTTAQSVLIYRVPSSGTSELARVLGTFGVPGIADGQFSSPSAVSLDGRGHVYVADTFNDRVQIVELLMSSREVARARHIAAEVAAHRTEQLQSQRKEVGTVRRFSHSCLQGARSGCSSPRFLPWRMVDPT